MNGRIRVGAGVTLLGVVLALGPGGALAQSPSAPPPSAAPAASLTPIADSGAAAVAAWADTAIKASVTVAKQFPPQSAVYLGLVQAAVYDAVVAIKGGYQPYLPGLAPQPDASVEAAVAAAAHDVLVHYFPAQQADLDATYTAALAAVAEGAAKTSGVALGQAAAAALITSRAGDGLEADTGFVMPSPGPGVWQLPADQKPQTPWMAQLRPFLLTSAGQFLPPPPPDLTSAAWATEFNETKLMGAKDSTARTPEQTQVALFFSAPATVQYAGAYRQLVADHGLDAVQAARLYAMGDMVGADALTACMNAKYHYLFWRPAFAIPGADSDGNDATVADPAWVPLLATPTHPEYPSNHGCYTASQGQVLASVLGTDQIDLTLSSVGVKGAMPTRHYASVADLEAEVANARIWGGLHYRGSDEAGVTLGEQVATWDLAHAFAPAP